MFAAGLQKNSLIDYPGKISCVVFLSGCNFACPYCHNPELARGEYPTRISLDQLLAFVTQRRMLLDGVVITGGEPTLHTGLMDFCRAFRKNGLAVKLDTNGSRPHILATLIQNRFVDFIAMDIKTTLDQYGPPLCSPRDSQQIAKSIDLVMTSGLSYEFRTTCVKPFVSNHSIEAIGRAIQGARQWTLQTFRPTVLLDPTFLSGSESGFPPEEMLSLQNKAAHWVQQCTLR